MDTHLLGLGLGGSLILARVGVVTVARLLLGGLLGVLLLRGLLLVRVRLGVGVRVGVGGVRRFVLLLVLLCFGLGLLILGVRVRVVRIGRLGGRLGRLGLSLLGVLLLLLLSGLLLLTLAVAVAIARGIAHLLIAVRLGLRRGLGLLLLLGVLLHFLLGRLLVLAGVGGVGLGALRLGAARGRSLLLALGLLLLGSNILGNLLALGLGRLRCLGHASILNLTQSLVDGLAGALGGNLGLGHFESRKTTSVSKVIQNRHPVRQFHKPNMIR